MKYNFTIPVADIPVANAPELGGESRVKLSYENFAVVAEITQPAPNSGNYVASLPAFAFDGTNGNDLALLAKTGIKSAVDVVVTFGVTFFDDTTGSATATFKKPTYAQNTSSNLPIGLAVDINGTAGNVAKKIKAINSITSFVGGEINNVFQVVSLPSTWFLVGCAKSKNFTPNVPKAMAVACGLNASAFVVAGVSDPGTLDLEALHFTYGDGLSQFNGHRGSVLVERYAAGRGLSERLVLGGFVAGTKNNRGDGDDEARDVASGVAEIFAVFV
jgi:hypothetical protein